MDENKWEYDYSSSNNPAGDTGYPNVGSSGMNTANTASAFSESTQPSGGATPPPAGPQNTAPAAPKKPKKNAGKAVKSIVALVLAAAMGFMGGFVGARFGGNNKVIIQQVERSDSSSADSESAAEGTTVSSGMTTAQVAKTVSPSVVVITTEQVVYSQWSWYGYILTCDHVVSGASNITVTIGDKDYTATVVGEDSTSDIAVIKIDADGLTPAIVGDSDKLAVGDNVLAVGNPLGELGGTVTSGIVSALNRSVSIQSSSSVNTMSLIQMDASVSPGNSGGGLFNMNGELIGIVNAKSSSSDAEGLGFAIPINDAIKVAQDLLENGYVTGRPYMGITYLAVNDAQTAAQLGVNAYGIYVVDVVSGGPADKAGLKAGDRIVSIDNTEVAQKTDLGTLMQEHAAGDTLSITVARDGQMQTVSLTLGEKNAANSGNGTNGASRQEKSAESAPQQNPQG
ncbi:MAG: serine protease HtrA [Faecalibacterium prausnitzii]|nr:MAG: serine protease HtrA [Faecalibacterium prausnitzii]